MNFVVVVCLTVHTNIQVKTAVNGKKKAIVLKKNCACYKQNAGQEKMDRRVGRDCVLIMVISVRIHLKYYISVTIRECT